MSDILPLSHTVAIIVLFWPDRETVAFIDSLAKGGLPIIAVVNAIEPSIGRLLQSVDSSEIILNEENLGLSYALNQGCLFAFARGATHVFLLDQDSRPSVSLPNELLADWRNSGDSEQRVGAIGPVLIDIKSKHANVGSKEANAELPITSRVATLATSGSLISKEAFETVGGMYEWLFIDDIDHEWCFRARYHNFAIMRANGRAMLHNMGDQGVNLFGRYRPIHRSPVRHYYILRNTIFMLRQPYVSWRWRLCEAIKTLYRTPVYLTVSSNRAMTAKCIIKAVKDGFQHKRVPKIE